MPTLVIKIMNVFESTPLFKKLSTNTNIVRINSNNGVLPANTFQLSKLFDGWMDGFSALIIVKKKNVT